MTPFIPDTGVSGKAHNVNWLVYRTAVMDTLYGLGAKCPEGLGVWIKNNFAKIKIRYDLGLTPEDAARDIYETWPRPYKANDGHVAIREAIADAKRRGTWNLTLRR